MSTHTVTIEYRFEDYANGVRWSMSTVTEWDAADGTSKGTREEVARGWALDQPQARGEAFSRANEAFRWLTGSDVA